MIIVLDVVNPTGAVKALAGKYLFSLGKGLYVGRVTKRLYEYLEAALAKTPAGRCKIILVREDPRSVTGFSVLEFAGDGDQRTQQLDGLTLSSK
jgi:hypothetical protein